MTETFQTEIVKLTPKLAEQWMTSNTHNRTLDRIRVAQYAKAMERGEWAFNGDPVRFSDDGVLRDGQHRCAAVLRSGVSIEVLVVRGLAASAQETMDRGKARTIGDALTLRGERNTAVLAGALNWLYRLNAGVARSNTDALTVQGAIALLEENPGLRGVGHMVDALRREHLLSPSLAWALAYKFSCLDNEDAADFFSRLASGADLPENHPILRLRTFLLAESAKYRGRTHPWIVAGTVIKAWNFYREGMEVRNLRLRIGGAHPDQFPEPR